MTSEERNVDPRYFFALTWQKGHFISFTLKNYFTDLDLAILIPEVEWS